jgi:hypothetical protein
MRRRMAAVAAFLSALLRRAPQGSAATVALVQQAAPYEGPRAREGRRRQARAHAAALTAPAPSEAIEGLLRSIAPTAFNSTQH